MLDGVAVISRRELSGEDDLDRMSEAINREIPTIDSKDLPDGRIGVDNGEDYSVDIGERLVDVLCQDALSFAVCPHACRSQLEELGILVDQSEDGEGDARVFPWANPAVISKLSEGLTDNDIRNGDLRPLPARRYQVACRPRMMPVTTVDRCNEQPAVSEDGHRRKPFYRR